MDSRMAERKVSVRLLRLGRDGRSCGVVVKASEHQVLGHLAAARWPADLCGASRAGQRKNKIIAKSAIEHQWYVLDEPAGHAHLGGDHRGAWWHTSALRASQHRTQHSNVIRLRAQPLKKTVQNNIQAS